MHSVNCWNLAWHRKCQLDMAKAKKIRDRHAKLHQMSGWSLACLFGAGICDDRYWPEGDFHSDFLAGLHMAVHRRHSKVGSQAGSVPGKARTQVPRVLQLHALGRLPGKITSVAITGLLQLVKCAVHNALHKPCANVIIKQKPL